MPVLLPVSRAVRALLLGIRIESLMVCVVCTVFLVSTAVNECGPVADAQSAAERCWPVAGR